ncbi:SLP2 [Symbiodinium natans]|uniref:SLP2 protein n=1 Tax=Symbiodinium natans TaxID=878477 RepID=A0A812PAJ4_9DINO|nr:SLP2 [Symbiodinium natans]
MAIMTNMGMHVFHPDWQNVRPGTMPQGRQFSTTFRMITLKVFGREEEIMLPVQTCTKVADVRDALARALGLDPESVRLRLAWLAVLLCARGNQQFTPVGFEDVQEVWIIGDLHGDMQCAEQWVKRTGLVDLDTWKWQGGERSALVFMGDYVDRGPDGLQVLSFVRNLTWSFPRNVLALMGNHDLYFLADSVLPDGATTLMGIPVRDFSFSFIHPEEYLNWVPASDAKAEDKSEIMPSLLAALQYVYQMRLERQVMMTNGPDQRSLFAWPPFIHNETLRQRSVQRLEQWQQHLAEGLHSSGLAEWLLERPALAVVAGTLFVHGGLMPVRDVSELVPLAPGHLHSDLGQLLQDGGAGLELLQQATTYRGFHADDPRGCSEVESVLRAVRKVANVSRIVVGHTPDDEVRIRCREKLVAADAALSRYYRAYGNRYCPIKTDVQRLANAGCSAPVPAECQGQVAHLQSNGKVRRVPMTGFDKWTDEEAAHSEHSPSCWVPLTGSKADSGAGTMRLKLVGRIGFEPLNSQFAHSASSAVDSSLETAGTAMRGVMPPILVTSALRDGIGILFLVKQGCSTRKQMLSEEVATSVIVKGIKSFRPSRHEWPHPTGVIGAGYNGLKTAMLYTKAGNDNYVVFDRNDKVGGYCWITAANTHSKLQTEFGSFHIWWGQDLVTEKCPYPKGWEIWPKKKEAPLRDQGGRRNGLNLT